MRNLAIFATIVAAGLALLIWQLFRADPKPAPRAEPAPAAAAPAPRATSASPAVAAAQPPPAPAPAERPMIAQREPPAPDVPVDRPTPHFDQPPEPEPEDDDLSDLDPERVARCKRAIAHTFDLWARESAQGDPEKFREALVTGQPRALAKCSRGEATLAQMDCVLASTTTAEIQQCGIGSDSAEAEEPAELDESRL